MMRIVADDRKRYSLRAGFDQAAELTATFVAYLTVGRRRSG